MKRICYRKSRITCFAGKRPRSYSRFEPDLRLWNCISTFISSQKKTGVKKILMENNLTSNHVLEDAENQIREACEVLQREATRLCQLKAIDAMSKKIEHFHLSSIVNLNVGGRRFTSSLQTLTKEPDSMLAAMFSRKFEVKPSDDGAFFIDWDGKHFRFKLNYLCTGKLTLPKGDKDRRTYGRSFIRSKGF